MQGTLKKITIIFSFCVTLSCANKAPSRGATCPDGKCSNNAPVSQKIDTPLADDVIKGAPAKIDSQEVQAAALSCYKSGKIFERRLVAASETPDGACMDEVDRSQFTCTKDVILSKITDENKKSILEVNFDQLLGSAGGFTLDQCAFCPANVDTLPCRKKIEENGETKVVVPTQDSFLFLFVKVERGSLISNSLDIEATHITQ